MKTRLGVFGFVAFVRTLSGGSIAYYPMDIPYPAAVSAGPTSINKSGQIVGAYFNTAGSQHGLLLSGGIFSNVDYPGGVQTYPADISASGQIVGTYNPVGQPAVGNNPGSGTNGWGFLLSGGVYTQIQYPNSFYTQVWGISPSGQNIVGEYQIQQSGGAAGGAFLLSGGVYTALKYPGTGTDGFATAFGVTDDGRIAGYYHANGETDGTWHGFLLSGGSYTLLDYPGAVSTKINGINNAGQIVGEYDLAGGVGHGYVLSNGVYTSIDYPGATFTTVLKINDNGQMAGMYLDSGGNMHGFLADLGVSPVSIATASPLVQGTAGVAYSQTLIASGGTAPYSWSVDAGSLPSGLSLGASTGTISGTPTAAGSYSFTVQVRDSSSATTFKQFALSIGGAFSTISIATVSPLPSAWVGGAYTQALSATGGAEPYAWSVISGSLPAGLTLSGGGAISGTPTAAGTFTFTVQAKDATGAAVTKAVTLVTVAAGSMTRTGVLSQVVSGGNWDTAIWLTNSSSSPVSVGLAFHADSGSDMNLTFTATQEGNSNTGAGTSLNRVISPNTTLVISTGIGVAANSQGWADVLANGPVSGFAVFRYASGGFDPHAAGFITPWEGTVPLQNQVTSSTMILPFDNTGGFATGFAIGNLTGAAVTITATLYDENGSQLGTPQAINLAAYGHTADMVGSRWSFAANGRGIVKFTGAAMTGLGLRASPYGTLTSLPLALQ